MEDRYQILCSATLTQTRKVPIQTLVNRIFVTQHHSKARITFAYVSCTLIISSNIALGAPVNRLAKYHNKVFRSKYFLQNLFETAAACGMLFETSRPNKRCDVLTN